MVIRIPNPAPRRMLLSTREVAEREGVAVAKVTYWCRTGQLWPVVRLSASWGIDPLYMASPQLGQPGRPRSARPKKPATRGRGRPPGVKNSRPYPLGVKRPRKKDTC